MVQKILKFISVLAVVALLISLVYEPTMPDLLHNASINPKKVTAKEVKNTFNQEYYDYCEEIRAYLETMDAADRSEQQMKKLFDEMYQAKAKNGGEYSETDIGSIELSKDYNYDECYENSVLDSDVINKGPKPEDYDLEIKDHLIYWYCKKDGEVATISPYHMYEAQWAIDLDRMLPGLCDWLKEYEEKGMDARTVDGQKVKVVGDNFGGMASKRFQGIEVSYSGTQIMFSIIPDEVICYEGITEIKKELEKSGWCLNRYFADGLDKGFVATLGLNLFSPTARVVVDEGKISRIELDYSDYSVIEKDYLKFYQKGLTALLRKAGIDDSLKDVLNGESSQSNYKTYTRTGDKEEEEVEPGQYEEFDSFMIVIYDIQ